MPVERYAARAIMVDGLVALLAFAAMIFLVRYFDRGRSTDALAFGLFATLCISSKSNGIALVLLPVFMILLTGRYDLLRRPGLYYAAGFVIGIGAPWQLLVYELNKGSLTTHYHSAITMTSRLGVVRASLWLTLTSLRWSLAAFFLLGAIVFLARIKRNRQPNFLLTGAFCLWLSFVVFHTILGICDPRYLLSAMPGAVILSFYGTEWVVSHISMVRLSASARTAALASLAAVLFLAQVWAIPPKSYRGLDRSARLLLSNSELSKGDYLVVADACGEGAFIAEVAMRDDRPAHYVYRGSKVLSSSTWFGDNYQFHYSNLDELRDMLRKAPVNAVVVETSRPLNRECNPSSAEIKLVQDVDQALASDQGWSLQDTLYLPEQPQETAVRLYARRGAQPRSDVKLNLHYTLGSEVVARD